jgi:integrase
MTSGNGRKRRSRNGITGSVYPRGKKWAYNVDLGPDPLTGERRRDARSGFVTEDAAWAALAEANSQLRVNRYVKNTPRTVRQFLDEWLVSVRISVKPTTYANYRNYVEYYVVPIIGERKLQEIAPETITRLYGHLLEKGRRRGNSNQLMYEHWRRAIDAGQRPKLAEMAAAGGVSYAGANRAAQRYRAGRTPGEYSAGLDARTVHSVHTMLNRVFRDAVNWRYVTENPVTLATRVRQSRKAHDVWTADQLRRFLAQARKERLYAMWLMFATTGMRRSEAAGATRALVDTDARTVTLWDTRVIAGGQAVESDGKTIRSRRLLALDRRTAAAVVDHLAMLDEERRLHEGDYDDRGLLFCWADGRPIYPETITDHFNRLVDRAGLPLITLHDVRHTYATMSLRAGVNPKIVSARLGHATVAFTLDTYTEDVPELHHVAAETVSGLFLDDVDDAPDEPPIDLL